MSSTLYSTMEPSTSEESDSDDGPGEGTGLSVSSVAIIIPCVIFAMLSLILIGFYIWKCYSQAVEIEEAKKYAESQSKKKVPIAEPEDFASNVPAADNSDVEAVPTS